MTTAERAQAAADFLNAGERWRVCKVADVTGTAKVIGLWSCTPYPRSSADIASIDWPTWLNDLKIESLAIAEGFNKAEE